MMRSYFAYLCFPYTLFSSDPHLVGPSCGKLPKHYYFCLLRSMPGNLLLVLISFRWSCIIPDTSTCLSYIIMLWWRFLLRGKRSRASYHNSSVQFLYARTLIIKLINQYIIIADFHLLTVILLLGTVEEQARLAGLAACLLRSMPGTIFVFVDLTWLYYTTSTCFSFIIMLLTISTTG